MFSFALMMISILIQLFVMGEFATKGSEIAALEKRRLELINENLELSRQIAETRNLDYIRKKGEGQGYVALKSNEVRYIELENFED